MAMDAMPPFHRTALMLDMDGTLIDLGPTPDAVVVTPGLTDTLVSLRNRLGGALAVVTGRSIETVDRLLGAAPGAVAGEHGGAIRHAPDAAIERPDLPSPPAVWLEAAEALVAAFPGALLERKARGFALHYRLAPPAGSRLPRGAARAGRQLERLSTAARSHAVGDPAARHRQGPGG